MENFLTIKQNIQTEIKKKIFLADLDKKIDEGEDDIANGRVREAREVFKELRQKYGY